MKNKMLEEICTFADECPRYSTRAFSICQHIYIDCKHYQEIIAQKIEEYNNKSEVLK